MPDDHINWTHENTWPDGNGHTVTDDFTVYRDGLRVGRIYKERYGPLKDQWQWFGRWVGNNNSGKCETLDEALKAVRSRAPADALIYDKHKPNDS